MPITPATLKEIIVEIAAGKTVKVCLLEKNITVYDFYSYLEDNPSASAAFEKALEFKSHGFADDIPDIADTDPDPARARVRIDARRWYASKSCPKKYADRVDINVKHIDITQALASADARLVAATINIDNAAPQDALPMCYLESSIDPQPIDTANQNNIGPSDYKSEAPAISNTTNPQDFEDDDIFS